MPVETQALIAYSVSLTLIVVMKIVCFILGYLTIRLGYQLISSGVKGEFKFSGELAGFKADLVSVSPGLLFVLLGILLIGYAIQVRKNVDITLPNPAVQKQQESPPLPHPPLPKDDLSEPTK